MIEIPGRHFAFAIFPPSIFLFMTFGMLPPKTAIFRLALVIGSALEFISWGSFCCHCCIWFWERVYCRSRAWCWTFWFVCSLLDFCCFNFCSSWCWCFNFFCSCCSSSPFGVESCSCIRCCFFFCCWCSCCRRGCLIPSCCHFVCCCCANSIWRDSLWNWC